METSSMKMWVYLAAIVMYVAGVDVASVDLASWDLPSLFVGWLGVEKSGELWDMLKKYL